MHEVLDPYSSQFLILQPKFTNTSVIFSVLNDVPQHPLFDGSLPSSAFSDSDLCSLTYIYVPFFIYNL